MSLLSSFLQTVYRLLARRWQSRLNVLLSQQERQDENARQQDEAAEELSDLLELAGDAQNNDNNMVRLENQSTLSGLRAMLQQLNGSAHNEGEDNDSDEEANVADEEPEVENMEEDEARENQDHSGDDDDDDDLLDFLGDENESESDDFASAAEDESDDNDSVIMEDVDDVISKSERAIDQPRSVSLSSDDL